MRERLESVEKFSSIKLETVERTGNKLIDLLHKANAWNDKDCYREDCIICSSCGESDLRGKCKKRNIVYETYCLTCETGITEDTITNNPEVEHDLEGTH